MANVSKIWTTDINNLGKMFAITKANIGKYPGGGSAPAIAGGIDSYTKLALHMDGDRSASQNQITTNGGPKLSSIVKKVGASSIYFDGSDDYLSVTDSDDWNFGSGDFTVDFWVRRAIIGVQHRLAGQINSIGETASVSFAIQILADNTIRAQVNSGSNVYPIISSGSIIDTDWHHIAFLRDGNTLRLFLDGSSQGTYDVTGVSVNNATTTLGIGRMGELTSNYLNGYLDEFRISKGIARWTTTFTPSTSAYTSDSYTKLLLHFDGDESDSVNEITFAGDTKLNAATTKWNGSYYFDGTGDYLTVPASADWQFGTGDFTIDTWFRLIVLGTYQYIASQWDHTNTKCSWLIMMGSDNYLYAYLSINGSDYDKSIKSNSTLTSGAFYHIALVRNGNVFNLYVDGVQQTASLSFANALYTSDLTLGIGGRSTDGNNRLNGYIDELRISKGIARWTSNFTPPTTSYSRSTDYPVIGDRGLFGGGYAALTTSYLNIIDYVAISTLGNAADFGDLTVSRRYLAACSSSVRGVFACGYTGDTSNRLDYVNFSTLGDASIFGNSSYARYSVAACSNSVRGLFGGGYSVLNVIDYITLSSAGSVTDFGDLTVGRHGCASCSSPTRGVFIGGSTGSDVSNTIDYVTINTAGNAADFGDAPLGRSYLGACSSSTRGVFGGGWNQFTTTYYNIIDYITIDSLGNASDFGDLTVSHNPSSCSNSIRGLFSGGAIGTSTDTNIIDYITISVPGNASDFSDLTLSRRTHGACSNGHGGLS